MRRHNTGMNSGLPSISGQASRYCANSASNRWSFMVMLSSHLYWQSRRGMFSADTPPFSRRPDWLARTLQLTIFTRGLKRLQHALAGSKQPNLQGVFVHAVHLLEFLERQS